MPVINTVPRKSLITGALLLVGAVGVVSAHADGTTSTGSCAKTFSVSKPTTMSCSFRLSAASHSFGVGGYAQPQSGSRVDAWTLSMTVDGRPSPFNTCEGVSYSGCGTSTWTSKAKPRGSVIRCTLRAVGEGSFECAAATD
jgi:hypothetical protein